MAFAAETRKCGFSYLTYPWQKEPFSPKWRNFMSRNSTMKAHERLSLLADGATKEKGQVHSCCRRPALNQWLNAHGAKRMMSV